MLYGCGYIAPHFYFNFLNLLLSDFWINDVKSIVCMFKSVNYITRSAYGSVSWTDLVVYFENLYFKILKFFFDLFV